MSFTTWFMSTINLRLSCQTAYCGNYAKIEKNYNTGRSSYWPGAFLLTSVSLILQSF